ncbi:MAG: homoserine dehydrogenase [Deltaproteobacteria bacterium]|jgi:homoserine dehydrogenase|nr:homoserine dehydrogenase [Deltaproteobacteria bacterium]
MITKIGLLGYGTVGAGVAQIVTQEQALLTQKLGWTIKLVKAVVRNPQAQRRFTPPEGLLTTEPDEVVGNPEIEVVCELIGGIEPARTLVLKALSAGQHVITANKALLALHGTEIFEKAQEVNRCVMFEAAVAGSIPIIRTIREGLSANRIQNLYGILNGTTNLILTRMSKDHLTFDSALKEAQQAGYAEADPTTDVMGYDAAHKLILLTALAYGVLPKMDDIHIEGITQLEPEDFSFASEFGYVIKLLAVSSLVEKETIEARLQPVMLPASHLLAGVGGAMNAVMVRGNASGDIFVSGPGAGMMPTASAVVGDILEVARTTRHSHSDHRPSALGWRSLKSEMIKPITQTSAPYYLRYAVIDRPGVLSSISGILGRHDISLAQVIQKGQNPQTGTVNLVMLTHRAVFGDLSEAVKETQALEVVKGVHLIRVEEFN